MCYLRLLPRHFGFASLRHFGLCALDFPPYDRPLQPRLPRRHSQHPAARHSGSLHPHSHLRLQ
ncbi:hypothetical protein FOXYSP1_19606 [Fusarium oxysporum f. sp. phaseoli]